MEWPSIAQDRAAVPPNPSHSVQTLDLQSSVHPYLSAKHLWFLGHLDAVSGDL